MEYDGQMATPPTIPEALSGMFERCEHCPAIHELLNKLNKCVERGDLVAIKMCHVETRNADDTPMVIKAMNFRCPACHGTGYVPTTAGKAMLWLLKSWL